MHHRCPRAGDNPGRTNERGLVGGMHKRAAAPGTCNRRPSHHFTQKSLLHQEMWCQITCEGLCELIDPWHIPMLTFGFWKCFDHLLFRGHCSRTPMGHFPSSHVRAAKTKRVRTGLSTVRAGFTTASRTGRGVPSVLVAVQHRSLTIVACTAGVAQW